MISSAPIVVNTRGWDYEGHGGVTPLLLAAHGKPTSPQRLPEAMRYPRAVRARMRDAPNERERIAAIGAEMERGVSD
jgi:hypothetical protein